MGRVARARMVPSAVASIAMACALIAFAPRAEAQSCPGDCGGDGTVGIEDLIKGVNIALGHQPVTICAAMDGNSDGRVAIQELILAVSMSLVGCATAPTATATASGGATATSAVATATALSTDTATVTPTATPGVTPPTATPTDTPATVTPMPFCALPGSVQSTGPGIAVVPGGAQEGPDLSFIELPIGFCVHYFGTVRNVRKLRFAPNGDLFVASPSKFTTSNAQNGKAAIVILPDDDRDGTADSVLTYMRCSAPDCERTCTRNQECGQYEVCEANQCNQLTETVGLLFTDGYLYYQDKTRIMRVPYTPGDRAPAGESEEVVNISYSSFLHWPKSIDQSDDGTLYVTNGGDENDPCPPTEVRGSIWKIDGSPNGALVAQGFRNPISLRCLKGHNTCFAIELTRDYSTPQGGREKLLPVRQGDDWGFPCCATKDTPYSDRPGPNCSGVAQEINSFFVGNTPFDLDYELGKWPEPWGNRAYVSIHGAYGSWKGARLVGIELDAMTGQVLPGSDLSGMSEGAMADFATGWDPTAVNSPCAARGRCSRPTAVAFAPDGRLFMGNDTTGEIIWIAPMGLAPPQSPDQ